MRILFNASIKTQNPLQPHATALAIRQQQVVAVGSDDEILALQQSGDTCQNMNGAVIWPGLTDAHIHLQHYAEFLQSVDCETPTRTECIQRVTQRVQSSFPGVWIQGHGWNQNDWPEGFGSRFDLDAIAPHNPVYLTAKSLHASWANSAALRIAGITRDTPDPQGGSIGRDASGEPTGILFESAMSLVEAVIPSPTPEQTRQALQAAIPHLWRMGLTGCHDFDYRTCFSALQSLHQEAALKFRVLKNIPLPYLENALELGLRSGFGDDLLRIGNIKCFADGALGPRTAAMLEPYEGESEYRGFPLLNADQIFDIGQRAGLGGFGLAIHAIGDLANREVLNAYAHLRTFEAQNHLPHYRHRIEHVQVLHPDDVGRLAEYDVIASMQPIHAPSDMYTADRQWGARAGYAYAWHALQDAGSLLVFGSDAPVESPNPFWGLHAAVTRQRHNGEPGVHGWYPEQRISLQSALDAFTTGPAFAAGMENRLGRLAPAACADLIVLPCDPFDQPPQELYAISPSAVMINGEWVHQS